MSEIVERIAQALKARRAVSGFTDEDLARAVLIAAAPDFGKVAREFVAPYAEVTDAQLKHAATGNPGTVTVTINPEIAAAVLRFRAAIAEVDGRG
jgi:hypothetical protein